MPRPAEGGFRGHQGMTQMWFGKFGTVRRYCLLGTGAFELWWSCGASRQGGAGQAHAAQRAAPSSCQPRSRTLGARGAGLAAAGEGWRLLGWRWGWLWG